MNKSRKRNNCPVGKDNYIFYRKNAEWFLSTIEELWNISKGSIEARGTSEMKSLKDQYFAIAFNKKGIPRVGTIKTISRYLPDKAISITGKNEKINIIYAPDHSFIGFDIGKGLIKTPLNNTKHVMTAADITEVNYAFSEYKDASADDAYFVGKVIGQSFARTNSFFSIEKSILFNYKTDILISFLAGLVDEIGVNYGIGFSLPATNNIFIAYVSFILMRIGIIYSVNKKGIIFNDTRNEHTYYRIRHNLRSDKKYKSDHSKVTSETIPLKGKELANIIKGAHRDIKQTEINKFFRRCKMSINKNIDRKTLLSAKKEFGINNIRGCDNFKFIQVEHKEIKNTSHMYGMSIDAIDDHIFLSYGKGSWFVVHNNDNSLQYNRNI